MISIKSYLPTKTRDWKTPPDFLIYFNIILTCFLLLSSFLFSGHDYPLSIEVLFTFFIFSFSFYFLHRCLDHFLGQKNIIYGFLILAILFYSISFQKLFENALANTPIPLVGLLLIGLLISLLIIFLLSLQTKKMDPKKLGSIFSVFVLAMTMNEIYFRINTVNPLKTNELKPIKNPVQPKRENRNQGNIYYFILDSHTALDGFKKSYPDAQKIRSKIGNFYLKNNFILFRKSYSNYQYSIISMASILNFSRISDSYFGRYKKGWHYKLKRIKLFDEILEKGYTPIIYQNDHFNYCSPNNNKFQYPINNCKTLPLRNLRAIRETPLSISSKTLMLLVRLGCRFVPFSKVCLFKEHQSFTFGMNSMKIFENLKTEIPLWKNSTFFFSHILLPHRPFMYDKQCEIRESDIWKWNSLGGLKPKFSRTPLQYQQYLNQVECVLMKIEEIIEVIQKAGLFEDATIIIHGDHGPHFVFSPEQNLPSHLYKKENNDSDRENFAAFLAIKQPKNFKPFGIKEPQLIQTPISISTALQILFGKPISQELQFIYKVDPTTTHLKQATYNPYPMEAWKK